MPEIASQGTTSRCKSAFYVYSSYPTSSISFALSMNPAPFLLMLSRALQAVEGICVVLLSMWDWMFI